MLPDNIARESNPLKFKEILGDLFSRNNEKCCLEFLYSHFEFVCVSHMFFQYLLYYLLYVFQPPRSCNAFSKRPWE